MALFMLGTILATRAIIDRMQHNIGFRNFVETSLEKYAICDWGDTCEVDQELNEHAVFHGERIVAKYVLDTTGDSIFIITEADRNITTILFTEEY